MNKANTKIFSDYAMLYDRVRLKPPLKIVDLILHYLDKERIEKIADLGSGTGLSTAIWQNRADEIIGIEPTKSMRDIAIGKYPNIKFIDKDSYNTGLESESVDVVTCSESFHWMEPTVTIKELNRILKPGGVFCSYYCDWPVIWNWKSETEYRILFDEVIKLLVKNSNRLDEVRFYPKDKHLENLKKSNKFRYIREICVDNWEECDSERFINLALTQSHLQDLLRHNIVEIERRIMHFKKTCSTKNAKKIFVNYSVILCIK